MLAIEPNSTHDEKTACSYAGKDRERTESGQ
jgi:hypothetical protein